MTINMLKAVAKMLDYTDKMEAVVFKARVDCAKEMLAQIIIGMEGTGIPEPHKIVPLTKPTLLSESLEGVEPLIIVDNGTLKEIKNLSLDAMIELDGKKMTHKEALGKKFTTGKIL